MSLQASRFAGNGRLQQAAQNAPPIRSGDSGEAVQIVQQALIDLGIPMPTSTAGGMSPPDGVFGDETVGAVVRFQAGNGLSADGIVGRMTLARLDEIFQSHADDVLFQAVSRLVVV